MKYKSLITYDTICGMILFGNILNHNTFDVHPKYPPYWAICKGAVENDF
jgi:hypothetical protein